jgi:hypothetical protein
MQTSGWMSAFLLRLAALILFVAAVSGKVAGDDVESPPAALKVNVVHSGRVIKFRGVRLEIVSVADDPVEEVAVADTPA